MISYLPIGTSASITPLSLLTNCCPPIITATLGWTTKSSPSRPLHDAVVAILSLVLPAHSSTLTSKPNSSDALLGPGMA